MRRFTFGSSRTIGKCDSKQLSILVTACKHLMRNHVLPVLWPNLAFNSAGAGPRLVPLRYSRDYLTLLTTPTFISAGAFGTIAVDPRVVTMTYMFPYWPDPRLMTNKHA